MQVKNFLLVFCLLAATCLGANNNPVTIPLPVSSEEGGPCDLPEPFNFHAKEVGPTWTTLEWASDPLIPHRIRIFRTSDNALLSTTNVPAGVNTATISIPFGTDVSALINSICLDGNNSPHEAHSPIRGVILELIVTGFQGSLMPPSCSISNSGICSFESIGITTFKISVNSAPYFRKFGLELVPTIDNQVAYKVHLQSPNNDLNPYQFYCTPDISPTPSCQTPLIRVTYKQAFSEVLVANIDAFQTSGTNQLRATLYNDGINTFRIERLSNGIGRPSDLSGGSMRERDEDSEEGFNYPAVAMPNPFVNALDVYPGNDSANKIHMQLYNLSGQLVMDQEYAGGQEKYTLSTSELNPGFYLLRIDADGTVQTIKVVKSE